VVDPASVATSRRRRRAKTDRIDGEALLRTLLAYKRGEPRVARWSKRRPPKKRPPPSLRERKVLTNERVQHVNRIKGLLFGQGVSGYEPLRRNRRQQLNELRTGDGRPLPKHLKTQISRELDRLELLLEQIKAVETERDALLAAQKVALPGPAAMLLDFNGIGPEFTAFSGPKDCSGTSTIGAKLLPMQGWRRRLGKVDPSITSRSFESRQSSIADNTHSTRLAMAAPSAAIRAGFVV